MYYQTSIYMVTINHSHAPTSDDTRPAATPTASLVTYRRHYSSSLIRLVQCRAWTSSSSGHADSTCRVLWRDLHSVRHPSHLTSNSHPHHHHWTRLRSPSECNLQSNMVLALHTVATSSDYYWPRRSQPLPSHLCGRTSLPANMSCIPAVRQCPITSYATRILPITAHHACCASACSRSCQLVRSRQSTLHLRRADSRSCLGPVLCLTETTSNLNPILLFPRFVNTAYPDLSLQHSSRAWPHANATTSTLNFP
jgi:hypothetical protein